MVLPVGSPAPGFASPLNGINPIDWSDKNTVTVWGFLTPPPGGPYIGLLKFRDNFPAFESKSIGILGVNKASQIELSQYKQQKNIPFLLKSDANNVIATAYQIPVTADGTSYAVRVAFVVNTTTKTITHVFNNADPATIAQQILAAV